MKMPGDRNAQMPCVGLYTQSRVDHHVDCKPGSIIKLGKKRQKTKERHSPENAFEIQHKKET